MTGPRCGGVKGQGARGALAAAVLPRRGQTMDVAIERCMEILKALALFTNTFEPIFRKKAAPD